MPQLVVAKEKKPRYSSAQLSMDQFDVNGDIPVEQPFPGTYWWLAAIGPNAVPRHLCSRNRATSHSELS